MRGNSSCRKHTIYSRQPPEQNKTKTRKQHECKWLQKHRRHTETNKHLLRERWEYRLGTVTHATIHRHSTSFNLNCRHDALLGKISVMALTHVDRPLLWNILSLLSSVSNTVTESTYCSFHISLSKAFWRLLIYHLLFLAETFMICVNVFLITRNKISA